jgi:hypothetical protein
VAPLIIAYLPSQNRKAFASPLPNAAHDLSKATKSNSYYNLGSALILNFFL